jgi:hypothetical protein
LLEVVPDDDLQHACARGIPKLKNGFLIRSNVKQGIMETAKFGQHYLTYFRCEADDRIVSLARYRNESAARQGHQRWCDKDWKGQTLRQLMMADG